MRKMKLLAFASLLSFASAAHAENPVTAKVLSATWMTSADYVQDTSYSKDKNGKVVSATSKVTLNNYGTYPEEPVWRTPSEDVTVDDAIAKRSAYFVMFNMKMQKLNLPTDYDTWLKAAKTGRVMVQPLEDDNAIIVK